MQAKNTTAISRPLGRRVAEQVIAKAKTDGSDAVLTGTVPRSSARPAYRPNLRAFTLAELLIVAAAIAVLAALLLPAATRALLHSKAWIWGVYTYENSRIEAHLNDTNDAWQAWYSTNGPRPYTFSSSPGRPADAKPVVAGGEL